jgi:HD-GYP domain-containing protein (c-di-GMP phosphodiesterase class II)
MQEKKFFWFFFFILAGIFFCVILFVVIRSSYILSFLIYLLTIILLYFYYSHKINSLMFYKNVYSVISQLIHYTEVNTLFNFIAQSISDLLDAERSSIFLVNKESNILWTIVTEELEIKEIVLPIGKGIAGYVAETGKTVRINDDAYKDERFSSVIDQKTGFRTKTILSVPVVDKSNNIIGVIEVLNKKDKKGFSKRDEEVLELFCNEVANVINNAQLYGQVQLLLESLLKSFAAAVDARDPTTKGHSLRVMRYAVNIAKAMSLDISQIKILEYAAILHDVGKIGIPDSILLKQGRFTSEEYEIMKTHAKITYDILSKINFPIEYKDVPYIASLHHEFMDGSGYPYGLKGEQIPLLARILCVADIYDALSSYDRPYKPPYSQQESIKILYEMVEQGKLDKNIVDIFVSKKLFSIEQRKFVRVNKEISFAYKKLTAEDLKSLIPILAKTRNISARGLQFISNEEFSSGTFIEVELYLPNFTIETIAKVVHSTKVEGNGGYKVGIEFFNLSKELEQRLQECLEKNVN